MTIPPKPWVRAALVVTLAVAAWWSMPTVYGADAAPSAPPASASSAAVDANGSPLSKLAVEYQKRLADADGDSADARYEVGRWAFEQYDSKKLNVEALQFAQIEFEAALEVDANHRSSKKLLGVVKAQIKDAERKLHPDYFAMAFMVIGGLGIFLLGMKNMSEGMQAVSGDRLRRMIKAVTDNRILAVGVGTGVTTVIQSSSITTVIVVGLVNSGLMALHQAIGVIMGANIGTTITGWILVLDIGKYGLPILGVAVFFFLFSRTDRWRYIAMAVLGLGLIFFGLELMKDGFKPLRDNPDVVAWFHTFDATHYFGMMGCVFVGCIITFIVQSSSATLGITIALASQGIIEFPTAAALVLGENIGTTITAWLASIGATTNAKRAAWAHILFNVIGVLWITTIFQPYIVGVGRLVDWGVHLLHGFGMYEWVRPGLDVNPMSVTYEGYPEPEVYDKIATTGIAVTHTLFNVANVLLFLPFVRLFARMLERIIPAKAIKETPHLTPLDIRMIESPVMGIETSRGEIIKMGRGVRKMLDWTRQLVQQPDPKEEMIQKVFNREKIMDNVQGEVIAFLVDLLTGTVPHAIAEEGRTQLRVADEYESISDYVSSILKAHLRLVQANLSLTDQEMANVLELHDQVAGFVNLVAVAFENDQSDALVKAHTRGDSITAHFKDLRDRHMNRLVNEKVDPQASMAYSAMLNGYRKIKDHAENIAEAMASEHVGG